MKAETAWANKHHPKDARTLLWENKPKKGVLVSRGHWESGHLHTLLSGGQDLIVF